MSNANSKVLPSHRLTLKDRLSRLTFGQACKLLGPTGKTLIQKSANLWDFKIAEDVFVGEDLCRVRIPGEVVQGGPVVVTITLMADAKDRLHWNCTKCETACEHVGAAFSLLLEEKSALGLAAVPLPRVAVHSLSEEDLVERALAERKERSQIEKMSIRSQDATKPWTDYLVTNKKSGKTYRVALRGLERGDSYCTCPDFRTNTL